MNTNLSRFVNDLDRVIQQHTLERGLKLAKGQCPNFEEYKRQVGQCEGLSAAVDIARQMLRKIELDDDSGGLPEMGEPDQTPPRRRRGKA